MKLGSIPFWFTAAALSLRLAIAPADAHGAPPLPTAGVTETAVITFAPAIPSGEPRAGSCWTTSIAVTRAGAYRCSVGNSIYDPCFAEPRSRQALVCDADPALKQDGFVLKLTKPLPANHSHRPHSPRPWIFKLGDGSICTAMTGTLTAVNGEPAPWECAIHNRDQIRRTGVVTKLNPGKVWTAERYPAGAIGGAAGGSRAAVAEQIPVKTIWQ